MTSIGLKSAPGVVALVLLAASAAFSDDVTWPPAFDFEQPQMLRAWSTQAPEGQLSITDDPENVRSGGGALELVWTATPGRLAMLSAGPVRLDGRIRSLLFSVKASEQSPIMYGVRLAGGVDYQGYMYTPGNVWHDLVVDIEELMLSESCVDQNRVFDAEQIFGIIVADVSNLSGEAGASLGIKTGVQRLWLDDVQLSDRPAPRRSRDGANGELIIDDFDGDVVRCLPIGNPLLELVPGPGEDDTSALRVSYDPQNYRWAGFVAGVGYLDLSERSHVALRVSAEMAVPLTVVLEERDGSKYQMRQRLDPEKGWHTLRLPFDRFKLDAGSHDENEQLDLDQLRVIIPVVDTSRAELGDNARGAWSVSRIWAE